MRSVNTRTLLIMSVLLLSALAAPRAQAPKPLDIYFIDVEGGQATLFVTPSGESMLIDTGHPGQGDRDLNRVLATIKDAGLTKLDYLLVTHYHSDHVGTTGTGMIGLLSDFATPFAVGEFIHVQDDGAEFMAPSRRTFETVQRLIGTWQSHGRIGTSTRPSFGTSQIDLGSGVSGRYPRLRRQGAG